FEDELYGRSPPANETSASMSGGTETTRYFSALLVKHDGGIAPNTFADKQSLRLNIDQNIGARLTFGLGADVIHTANDRGLFNNENNGSPLQAGLSSMPSFIDYRGTCPDGSRVTNPANPCAGAGFRSTSPYAFSNPSQPAAGTSSTTQVGIQFESSNTDRSSSLSRDLIGGQPNVGSGTVLLGEEYRQRVRDLGLFAQEEFLTFNERVLLTVGGRADQSTNNSAPTQLYFSPNASASHRLPGDAALFSK